MINLNFFQMWYIVIVQTMSRWWCDSIIDENNTQVWEARSRSGVATSWETGKLVLQMVFYLNLLFQNTWSYIKWWLFILWHPRIDHHSHALSIVMQEWGCFELVYVKSWMKSQCHETRSCMKLTRGGNVYDQSTRNWQH